MQKKLLSFVLILLVITLSALVVILPTFFTKGLSRVELQQDFQLDLILDKESDIELIFFGYAGCVNICTPRLESLGRWYSTLPLETQERVGLKLLDLSVPQNRDLPDDFVKAFHEKFEGVFLDKDIIRVYTKAFSVYFATSMLDSSEVDHTAHLYLVKRGKEEKQLRFIYTAFPYDFKQIQSDIQELLNE
ncbi:SCO family protein [Campylobacterota bacterium]